MKYLFFLASFICLIRAEAQDNPRIKEYHFSLNTPIQFDNLSFNFDYKRQLGENANRFLKASFVSLSFSQSNQMIESTLITPTEKSSTSLSGGLGLGIEFRRPVNDILTFFHGPNITGVYSYMGSTEDTLLSYPKRVEAQSITGSIPYTLGMMIALKPKLFLSLFINPSVSYTHSWSTSLTGTNTTNITTDNIGFKLNDQFAGISIAFRK